MNILPFAKMQALGNDFIVIDGESLLKSAVTQMLIKRWTEILPTLASDLCNRHLGIGADGLILGLNLKRKELKALADQIYGISADDCELAWTYTNNDGFSPQTCGNGLRCLALWAHKKGLITDRLNVLTKAGIVEIVFRSEDDITTDLGPPYISAEQIPYMADEPGKAIIQSPLSIGNETISITCVNMGNPHCLIFAGNFLDNLSINLPFESEQQLKDLPRALTLLAQAIQADDRFPEGINVSFVLTHDRQSAQAIVFERGCGPTLACGSAAAAILVAGVLENRLSRQATITLPGGSLFADWSPLDNHVRISGEARLVFEGQFILPPSLSVDLKQQAASLKAGPG